MTFPNIDLEHAHIDGTQGALVQAGGHLVLREGRDVRSTSSEASVDKSGLFGRMRRDRLIQSSDTSAKSHVQSDEGKVALQAGGILALSGVDLHAAGDVNARGAQVLIRGATDTSGASAEHSRRSKGLHLDSLLHDPGSGFGAKRTDTHESHSTSLVRNQISGANVSIEALDGEGTRGELHLAGTTVTTAGTLRLSAQTLHQDVQQSQSDTRSASQGRDLMWQKTRDQGRSDQRTHYNELNAGQLELDVHRVQAGLGARDSIEQLAQQPGMHWVQQLQNDPQLQGKVDWQRVQEAHERWDYKQQGLTPEGAAIVTVVVGFVTYGAALELGASAGAAAGGGTTGTMVGGAVTAGTMALASQASVSLINNQGDLGKTLKELGSSQSVKNLVSAIATGGALAGLNATLGMQGWTSANVQTGTATWGQVLSRNLVNTTAAAVIDAGINGTSFEDAIRNGLVQGLLDTAAQGSASWIGLNTGNGALLNDFTASVAHAVAGCAVGAARTDSGSGCSAGAVGAVVGELSAKFFDPTLTRDLNDTVAFSQFMAGLAGVLVGGDQASAYVAAQAGSNVAANNHAVLVRAAQLAQQVAAQGTGIVTAEGQILLQRCAASPVCSMGMPAIVLAWVQSQNTEMAPAPTGAAAIPNENDSANSGDTGSSSAGQGADTYGTPPDGGEPPPGEDQKDSPNKVDVQFGNNANQEYHAFRHVERVGIDRKAVEDAIRRDLSRISNSMKDGIYSGSVNINGVRIDYAAYRLPNGVVNVGRITPIQ